MAGQVGGWIGEWIGAWVDEFLLRVQRTLGSWLRSPARA